MPEKNEPLKELVGFNLNAEQKEILKAMADYLHFKGIISNNTYAEAARWSISTIGSMIKEVIPIEMSGKTVSSITIPLVAVSSEEKLAQEVTKESSADTQ